MNRTENLLHRGARRLWPGSEDHLVAVCRAYGADLRMAALISAALNDDAARPECLRLLRRDLPTSSRRGPKLDRYTAAVAALDALDRMAP